MTVSRMESSRRRLETSPDDTFLLYSLGMELLGAGQPAEALARFQRILELDAGYLAAYSQAAKAMQETGDPSGAADMLRRGMALAERVGDHHSSDRLALLLAALGAQP